MGRYFIDHPSRKTADQASGYISLSLDGYGRLADFIGSSFQTGEKNDCLYTYLLKTILTDLFHNFDYAHPRIPVNEIVEPSGLAWIDRFGWKVFC